MRFRNSAQVTKSESNNQETWRYCSNKKKHILLEKERRREPFGSVDVHWADSDEATNFRVPDYTTVRVKCGSIIIYMS